MSKLSKSVAITAMLAGSLFAAAGTAQAKKCVLAGGQGNGVTKDIAIFMAKAALKNSQKKLGVKPAGKTKVSCDVQVLFSSCTAKQRACK